MCLNKGLKGYPKRYHQDLQSLSGIKDPSAPRRKRRLVSSDLKRTEGVAGLRESLNRGRGVRERGLTGTPGLRVLRPSRDRGSRVQDPLPGRIRRGWLGSGSSSQEGWTRVIRHDSNLGFEGLYIPPHS